VLRDGEAWRLVLGDAVAEMSALPDASFDAVVTDPPYGTDVPRDGYGRRQLGAKHIEGDADLSVMAAGLVQCFRLQRRDTFCLCFCSPKKHAEASRVAWEAGYSLLGEVVWDKLSPGLGGGIRYQHEQVLILGKGKPSGNAELFSVVREASCRNGIHPHEKPVRLMQRLVRYACPEGGRVLDPFAGLASTGVACLSLGLSFVGVESDPAYHAAGLERLTEAAACPLFDAVPTQGQLFGPP
jgi:adenine-specific DNA-methyltransferase